MQQLLYLHPSFSFYLCTAGEWWGGKSWERFALHLPRGDSTLKCMGLRGLCVCVSVHECVSPLAKNRATSAYKMCNVLKCSKTLGARKRERLLQWHHLAYTRYRMNSVTAGQSFSNKHTNAGLWLQAWVYWTTLNRQTALSHYCGTHRPQHTHTHTGTH